MNSRNFIINLASKLLQPINIVPPSSIKSDRKLKLARSYKLMVDLGVIRVSSTGIYSLLPIGIRSIDKLRNIVKLEMSKLFAQEVKFPYLTESILWKKSGRFSSEDLGIFLLKDRHDKDIILSPTNEEVAAHLMASIPQISYHQLPILIYQIATKFRDEIKPRCGLLKSKEFEMKDLYSFDSNLESAQKSYESVTAAYRNIFDKVSIPVMRVVAENGDMKGISSHEYHVISDLGEDILIRCNECLYSFNSEQMTVEECRNCKSKSIHRVKGIEVGHTFLLGDVYSKPLNAVFKTSSGVMLPLVMASYGLGLTRLLAAGVEYLSSEEEIAWPSNLAPYSVVLITPKGGSKEYATGKRLSEDLYLKLNQIPYFLNDVLIDDRENMTIGKRLLYAKRMGYPFIIVLGSKVIHNPALYEIINTKDGTQKYVTFEEVIDYLCQDQSEGVK